MMLFWLNVGLVLGRFVLIAAWLLSIWVEMCNDNAWSRTCDARLVTQEWRLAILSRCCAVCGF
jgi:hypothetical protein